MGRGSTYDQRGNCTTLTCQKYFSSVACDKQYQRFLVNSNQCPRLEVPIGTGS